MNRNIPCTNFFWRYVPASAWHLLTPPLQIIITVCHEQGRPPYPLPLNRYVFFEPPLQKKN